LYESDLESGSGTNRYAGGKRSGPLRAEGKDSKKGGERRWMIEEERNPSMKDWFNGGLRDWSGYVYS